MNQSSKMRTQEKINGVQDFYEDLYKIFEPKLQSLRIMDFGGIIDIATVFVMIDDIMADLEIMFANHNSLKDQIGRAGDFRERDHYSKATAGAVKHKEHLARRAKYNDNYNEEMDYVNARLNYLWSVKNRLALKREALLRARKNGDKT